MAGYILNQTPTATWQQAYGIKPTVHYDQTTPASTAGQGGGGGGGTATYNPSGSSYGANAAGSGGGYYGSGGGGGGGGSWPSFSYSNPAVPTPTPVSAGVDFSGLIGGVTDLLKAGQKSDIPDSIPLSTQKDTMQLQGLRESAAGWNELAGQGGGNPALGNRIPPDESKKLAALNAARIY